MFTMKDLLADGDNSPQETWTEQSSMPLVIEAQLRTSKNSQLPSRTTSIASSSIAEQAGVVRATPPREAHDAAATNNALTHTGGTSKPAGTEDMELSLDDADVEMTDADVVVSQEEPLKAFVEISTPSSEMNGEEAPIIRVVTSSAQTSVNDSMTSSSNDGGSQESGGASSDSVSLSHSVGENLQNSTIESMDIAEPAVAEKASKMNIRIDKATGNVSILDALRALDAHGCAGMKGSNAWTQLQEWYSHLRGGTTIMQLNGKGVSTGTAPPLLLCEIAYLAMEIRPGIRREALVKVMEFLSVDVAWLAKWETKYSTSKNRSRTHDKCVHVYEEEPAEEQESEGEDNSSDDACIRVDEKAKVGCILDTLRFVDTKFPRAGGSRTLSRVYAHFDAKIVQRRFCGNTSLVAGSDYGTLVEIGYYWMAVQQQHTSQKCRKAVKKLCDVLGVDARIIDKLEKANVPTATTSGGKRKAAVLESDEGRSTSRDSIRHSVENSASAGKSSRVSSKASSLSSTSGSKKVYVAPDFHFRIDKTTNLGSVSDVINNVLSRHRNVSTADQRSELASEYPVLGERIKLLVCNGQGDPTPLADIESLLKTVFLVSGKVSKEHREYVAKQVCYKYGRPGTYVGEVQKSLAKEHVPQLEEGSSAKRASKEKRARATPTSQQSPSTKRGMTMRASTAVCTKASHNAQGSPARSSSSSMDSMHAHIESNQNSENRRSKGKDRDRACSDAHMDNETGRDIGSKNAASVSEGAGYVGADGAGGGSSNMNVVQDSKSGADMQASIEKAKANDALLPILLAQLEGINQSGASEHAKKLLEQRLIAQML